MGAGNNKVRVVSLNYSGIFVSPFQFYAIDNWKELQQIGIIFQRYMKQQYQDIKKKIADFNKKNQQVKKDDYVRKTFDWSMSGFDKDIKYGRYCPLYLKQEATSESLNNIYKTIQMYPGMRINFTQYQNSTLKFQNRNSYFDKIKAKKIELQKSLQNQKITSQQKLKRFEQLYNKWVESSQKTFETRQQFEQSWQKNWQQLQPAIKLKKIKQPSNLQKQMTKVFDFFVYRAIVQFVFGKYDANISQYNIKDNLLTLSQYRRHHFYDRSFQFKEIIPHIQQSDNKNLFAKIYCAFMNRYFEIIDVQKKIKITTYNMTQRYKIDVMNFQQANYGLRKAFKQIKSFFTLGPINEQSQDQSLLIFRNDLSIIPQYYKQNFDKEQDYVKDTKNKLQKALQFAGKFNQINVNKIVQDHFPQQVSNIIQQKIKKFVQKYKTDKQKKEAKLKDCLSQLQKLKQQKSSEAQKTKNQQIQKIKKEIKKLYQTLDINITKIVHLHLSNPLKVEMDKWLRQYQQFFLQYWGEPKKYDNKYFKLVKQQTYNKQVNPFIQGVKQHGLLFFGQSLTFTDFNFTHKGLQKRNNQKMILGNIHLTSKQTRNKMQAHVIGMLIAKFKQNGYKFILSGDFNTYMTLKEKQNQNGLFTFFIQKYKNKLKKQNVKDAFYSPQIKLARQQLQQGISIYPKHNKIFTTKKKRTILQVQTRKSNELKEVCIDQIISNCKINNQESFTGDINYLGSKQNKNKQFLPYSQHPYDHYVVETNIELNFSS